MKNREIKFRIWSGIEMIYDVTVGKFGAFYVNPGAKGDGLDPNDSASLTPFTTKYSDNAPVMQFTGLKDKNGKEIYESDLCKKARHNSIYEVVFRKGAWTIKTEDDKAIWHQEFCNGAISTELEIIGNIYEHPTLTQP